MIKKFLRYNLVQISAYVLDIGTFLVLIFLLPSQLVFSNISGKIVAGIYAFYFHKHFTFKSTGKGRVRGELFRFTVLLGLNSLLSTLLLLVLAPYFVEGVAKVIADIICVGLSFFLANKLVFKAVSNDGPKG